MPATVHPSGMAVRVLVVAGRSPIGPSSPTIYPDPGARPVPQKETKGTVAHFRNLSVTASPEKR